MQVATGKSILNGIAIGPLRIYKKTEAQTTVASTLTPEEEYARFDAARVKAQEQLGGLYNKALDEVGEDNASIFEIHQMMLDDDDYLDAVKGIIETQNATAEYAVSTTGENFYNRFLIVLKDGLCVEFNFYLHESYGDAGNAMFQAVIDSVSLS